MLCLITAGAAARAQCTGQWLGGFASPMMDGSTSTLARASNGDLLAGGFFFHAGGVTVNHVARWNGTSWSALGSGVNGRVSALTNLNNGDLVAGGGFLYAGSVLVSNIARWNGTSWFAMGTGMNDWLNAVTTLPNGDLVAGGYFTFAGQSTCNRIARWNGTNWSPMGTGMNDSVQALIVMPNGDLVAGGQFTTAGGVPANYVARWNGTSWAAMGSGLSGIVMTLASLPNGDIVAGGAGIARWNGASWSTMGSGMAGGTYNFVYALQRLPSGDIIAAGNFTTAGGVVVNNIARWNGTAWSPLGTGVSGTSSPSATVTFVTALAMLANGDVVAGGEFATAGGLGSAYLAGFAFDGPTIQTQPVSTSACAAGSASFFVGGSDPGPLSYAWRRGEITIDPTTNPSAATATLLLSHVQPSDAGSYDCIVTNACGSTTSDAATLTICYANCDCSTTSPTLNVLDFSCFLNRFASGDPLANCDGSTTAPVLNVLDFSCFLNAFSAGCP